MAEQADITAGVNLVGKASTTQQDLNDAIENMTIGGLNRAHADPEISSIPAIGTSAPVGPPDIEVGETWIDTKDMVEGAGTTNKVHTVKSWNGAAWRPVNGWHVGAAPPAYTAGIGMMWLDTALEQLRIYNTVNSITNWHPVNPAYQVWQNKSGGTVAANRIVTRYTATAIEQAFTTSSFPKTMAVVGVTMESIASDAYGVICMVGSTATVDIYCNVTDGNVVMGDGITNSQTAGEGRTCDLLPTQTNTTTGKPVLGAAPFGCFAEALEARASPGVVTCRMLGFVGGGLQRMKAATPIASLTEMPSATWDGATWTRIDMDAYPIGAGDFIDSGKHKPICGVILNMHAAVESTSTADVTATLSFSKDAGSTTNMILTAAAGKGANDHTSLTGEGYVPTAVDVAPYVGPGQAFWWKGSKSAGAGTPSISSATMRATGYIYGLALMSGLSVLAGGTF